MSNNASDYENDLVFPPKSTDDLNEQRRQSDVLIGAIEKCEKLQKKLDIAIEALYSIVSLGGFPMMNTDRFSNVASDALRDIAAVDRKEEVLK